MKNITDTDRVNWYFSSRSKTVFLRAYVKGLEEGWTADQWRAAIDKAMADEAPVRQETTDGLLIKAMAGFFLVVIFSLALFVYLTFCGGSHVFC